MTTPIYSLKGSENLPKKKAHLSICSDSGGYDCNCGASIHNTAITQIEKCGITTNNEELAKIIYVEGVYAHLTGSWDDLADSYKVYFLDKAKSLSSTLPTWIEIRRIEND